MQLNIQQILNYNFGYTQRARKQNVYDFENCDEPIHLSLGLYSLFFLMHKLCLFKAINKYIL